MSNPVGELTRYELDHLVAHLIDAGREQDVHRLLLLETSEGRNAWYEAKSAKGEAFTSRADVLLAFKASGQAESVSRSASLQLRYALTLASISSLSQNVPSALRAALVRSGVWSAEQGLADARLIVEPDERAEALFDLLPALSASHSKETVDEVLSLARTRGPQPRARLLLRLVPFIPGGEPSALLQEALIHAQQIGVNSDRAKALTDLLPSLSLDQQPTVRREAVEAARAENAETDRGQAWARLWLYLSEAETAEALQRVRTYADPSARASAALELAQVATDEAQRATLLSEAESAAALITDSTATGIRLWLALLRPSTPLGELVRMTAQQDARLLRFLCEHLPVDTPAETTAALFAQIEAQPDDDNRSRALAALLPRLSAADRGRVVTDLIEMLPALRANRQRSNLARDLAPYLSATQVRRVADFVRSNDDQVECLARVARFAQWYSASDACDLYAVLTADTDGRWRTEGLIDLAAELPAPQRTQALTTAVEGLAAIQYQPGWIDHAMALIYLLEGERQSEVLNWILQAIFQLPPGSSQQIQDLARLLPHLDAASQQNLTTQTMQVAWNEAQARHDFSNWHYVLQQLSPFLPDDLAQAIFATAEQIDDRGWRAITLLHLAPHLVESEQAQAMAGTNALALSSEFTEPQLRAALPQLSWLSEAAQQRVFTLALTTARETPRIQTRALNLAEVAVASPETDRPAIIAEALEAARLARSPQALIKLIPQLPDTDRQSLILEAIACAREVRVSGWRNDALTNLAPAWAALPLESSAQVWRDTLLVLSGYPRTELLADCVALKPAVEELGGSEVADELHAATLRVLRWWP